MRGSRRAGRLLVLGFEGATPPAELIDFASRFGLGGVILFAKNCPDTPAVARCVRELRQALAEADPGGEPLVLVDQEGGRVERIRDGGVPRLAPALALGEAGEAGVQAAVGEQARSLRSLGIDVNLAPVCDVLQPGESGAIGDRSFGSDPAGVGRLAAAHVRATLAAGVIPCAKHFPGHGAAREDSHLGLPRVDKSLDELLRADLVPFSAVIEAGVPIVMAAHVVFPEISPLPASLAPEWLGEVLRRKMGFGGAVVSDDMHMGALAGLGPPGSVAVRAVLAGCDLLIYGRMLRPDLDVASVAESLEKELPPDRLCEALRRRDSLPGCRP